MAMMVYEAARKSAREVLPVFNDNLDVDSLIHLANNLGATVQLVHDLPDKVSGMVVQQKGQEPEIFIRADEPVARQRFTLAHEIGHIIERLTIGHDDEYSFVDYRKTDNRDLHEFFANEFAGELLMPKDTFLAKLSESGPVLTSLHFGVSLAAVQERARRLEKQP